MKKGITILSLVVLMLLICASTGNGNETGLSLQEAIEQSAEEISSRLPTLTRVAIATFDSEHQNVSNYIMDELAGAMTGGSLEVTDRRNLAFIYKELGFQMSGDVSDETAVSIGKFLGAQYVIIGQFMKTGNYYRYRVSCIKVETAVQESSTRLNVLNSRDLQSLIADLRNAKVTNPTAYSRPANPPGTAGAFLDRGIILATSGEFAMAIEDFTEAIQLNPNFVTAYQLRARALFANVSSVFEIEENFNDIITYWVITSEISEVQLRGYEQAIADYEQAIRLDPNNAINYDGRGRVFADKGDLDLALEDFNQAIRRNPNAFATYNQRGGVFQRKGDNVRAIADFTQAIRLNPNYAVAYYNRGSRYLNRDEFDLAIADFNEVIRINPNHAPAYNNRGRTFDRKGDYDKAIADFNTAIHIEPNVVSYNNRANTYLKKGDFSRAIADWETVLRIDPNNTYAMNGLEIARRNRGR